MSIALCVSAALFFGAASVPRPCQASETSSPNADAGDASPPRTDDDAFIIGPVYADAPELWVRPGIPKGTLHDFAMNSENSTIYPGIAKNRSGTVPYARKVCVYVPDQYASGNPAPFIIVQDGIGYRNILPQILDNLIYDNRLPVMIAIMVDSGGGDGKGSQRGLEYDTLSGTYTEFIEREVLPRIAEEYAVTFTKDPKGRATMGGSSGGAAAFTMAWFHPELYHRVLTYSGTYVNQQWPSNPESPHGAWEYHEHLILESERKPMRVWLHVSEHDYGANRDEASQHNWVMANERMAAALKAKGYRFRFVYALDARHVDPRVIRQTLPEALVWLWGDF